MNKQRLSFRKTTIARVLFASLLFGSLLACRAQALTLPFLASQPALVNLSVKNSELQQGILSELRQYREQQKDLRQTVAQQSRSEIELIHRYLRSRGYYQPRVRFHGISASHNGALEYTVEQGPRYTIDSVSIEPSGHTELNLPRLSLQAGAPILAKQVLDAQSTLQTSLLEQCRPQAQVTYRVILNARKQTGAITFMLKPGPRAHVGQITLAGVENIDLEYLRNEMSLAEGDCFRRRQLDKARLDLLQTGLIASAEYRFSRPRSSDDQSVPVDVVYQLVQRRQRSITSTLSYTSDAKTGITLGWQHRNLFGHAEQFEIEAGTDQISDFAKARLTLPQFFSVRQKLDINAEIKDEVTDAYESRWSEVSAIVSRDLREYILASLGVALTQSKVTEDDQTDTFSLLSVPMALAIDQRDEALDASRGWFSSVSVRPFTDLASEDVRFVQTAMAASVYFSESGWRWQPTLALRASIGTMTGAGLEDIPADHRFYVGGGGSVRGYPYQTVGELTDGEADGGKSFGEVSAEVRLRFTPSWGLVIFTDGGYAYPAELPSFGEHFLWGAGLGLRYLTSFAPIRFDIAVPLNRRRDVDDPFQIYFSIGQAF